MQKSTSFLVPMMNFSGSVYPSLIGSYIGNVEYEGDADWGNYLYLEYEYDKNKQYIYNEIREHAQFIDELHDDNSIIFILKFTDKQRETIVNPFKEGKYSKIDRNYVAKYFPKYNREGRVSNNWRILMKDEWDRPNYIISLRDYWEGRIGIPIPVDAEVWDRPMKREEVRGYEVYELLEVH